MSALGELLILVIYFFLGVASLAFLVFFFFVRRSFKFLSLFGSFFFCFLFFLFKSNQDNNYRNNHLRQVGVYILKNYRGCIDCKIELKEDMTYVVLDSGTKLESSNWHYEMGGDYFITWLDNDRKQLGSGDYEYSRFIPKLKVVE
jgi:hypothetical protein